MRTYDILLKKRNGKKLTEEEIEFMVNGFVKGDIPDYQMSAFLMAIFFRHLDNEERFYLTKSMLNSGDKVDLSMIEGMKIDKHSTGGVGDKTTLVFAPIIASFGFPVAKMSGRSLGHTGGTIDKLESIPGFRTSLELDEFIGNVKKYNIAIVSQTANLAPADKKIYALRDVTATVDEISLISSSIMSKKLAVSSDLLLLDVKFGSGAFMKKYDDAKVLAEAMVDIAKKFKRNAVAILTSMEQPLGRMVGNSLEVLEAIETLKGNGPDDFTRLCVYLGACALSFVGVGDIEENIDSIKKKISSGEVLKKFEDLVIAQGGDPKVIENPKRILPISKDVYEVKSKVSGYVEKIDAEKIGIASMLLGAGRMKKDDKIDHSVGIELLKKIGDEVKEGDPLVRVYFSSRSDLKSAVELVEKAYSFSDKHISVPSLIGELVY
ncbi:MAG TPA: thymidine phosphorylase [Thermotogaceae bacterium]|nr:thymidine phosphorylase [Thermotogaceae bacterium]